MRQEIDEINEEIKGESLEFIEKLTNELKMVKPRGSIYVDKNKLDNPFFLKKKTLASIDINHFTNLNRQYLIRRSI